MIDDLTVLLAGPAVVWLPAVTLLYLLASQPWKVHMPAGTLTQAGVFALLALASAGLLVPGVARAEAFWLAITLLHVFWLWSAYHLADNHHYLIAYWTLAIACSLWAGPDREEQILAQSACWLIGTCFLLAAIAKIANRTYRDGSFFVWQLATDQRFLAMAVLAGGLSAADRSRHTVALYRIRAGLSAEERAPVPVRLWHLSLGLTVWTVFIEAAVALVFLLPTGGLDTLRLVALLLFVITTFSMVPVPAFGQLLLIMLLATTTDAGIRLWVLALTFILPIISIVPQALTQMVLMIQRAKPASPASDVRPPGKSLVHPM